MRYIAFLLFIVTNIALGRDNVTLDVNTPKGITAKIVLKDNDSLSVSVLDGKKNLSTEDIDVSSEKKIIFYPMITIGMVIKILVYGIWMKEWVHIRHIGCLFFLQSKRNSRKLNQVVVMSLSISASKVIT
nr:hypothetical protein [Atlantibacter sp.]